MKRTSEAVAQLGSIPRPRLVIKIRNTFLGFVFISGAAYGAVKLAWPWYVVLSTAFFGGYLVSQDLVKRGGELLVALLKDLIGAVRGKNGSLPSA